MPRLASALDRRRTTSVRSCCENSARNYFSSRDALFQAIVERFADRERANFDEVALTVCPTSPIELGRALAQAVRDSTETNRTLTVSRYALLVESANNPDLREQMAVTGARVSAWFTNWLRLVGSHEPDHHMHVIGNYVTGLVLHQLAIPDPHFDPTAELVSLLETLIGPRAPAAPTRHAMLLGSATLAAGGHHGS